MSLQGKYGPDDERDAARPVAWKGPVTRTGEGAHRTLINGRQEEIRFIKAKIGDADVALLDDPRFPLGMADKITEIRTSIRARLVDESGLGIPGAVVTVPGGRGSTSGPDGRFIIPPSTGKVKLTVTRGGKTLGEPEIDLTAPGRVDVLVTVPRPRTELLFITKPASGTRRAKPFGAGETASRPLHRRRVPGRDPQPHGRGGRRRRHRLLRARRRHRRHHRVTEDGLHGSSSGGAARSRAWPDLASRGALTPFAHVHAAQRSSRGGSTARSAWADSSTRRSRRCSTRWTVGEGDQPADGPRAGPRRPPGDEERHEVGASGA
jgi:hypothetical protein